MAERGSMTRAAAALLLATAWALLGVGLTAAPSSAHATLVASWPAAQQVLAEAPDHVVLEFSTEVSPDALVAVVDPEGDTVSTGDPVVDGRFLTQAIRSSTTRGDYVGAVHVLAADMHPIIARFGFTVDPGAAPTTNPAGAEPDPAAAPGSAPGPGGPGSGWLLGALGAAVLLGYLWRLVGARRRRPTG